MTLASEVDLPASSVAHLLLGSSLLSLVSPVLEMYFIKKTGDEAAR
jgi:hypothetical protein